MKLIRLNVLMALLLLACFCVPARGETATVYSGSPQGKSAQDELPFGDLFTAEEMSKDFASHQFTPFGESKFSFEILTPKGWESHLSEVDPGQLAQDTQAPVPMAEFAPGGADDVGIQVLYMRVPAEVPLDRFLDNYVKNSGGTLVVRQKLESRGGAIEDVLMKSNAEDLGPLLSRVAAFRRGDIVYIFSGWGVEEKYEKHKQVFGAVLGSFNPTGH